MTTVAKHDKDNTRFGMSKKNICPWMGKLLLASGLFSLVWGCNRLSYDEQLELNRACAFLATECQVPTYITGTDEPKRCVLIWPISEHKYVVLFDRINDVLDECWHLRGLK